DVATLGASTSAGTLTYAESNAPADGILGGDGTGLQTCGVPITGAATTIDLKTGGLLTISNDIAAANNATVDLTSGAGITEGAAKITTGGALGMSAAGTINVNSTTNDVTRIAESSTSVTLPYRMPTAAWVGTLAAAPNFPGSTGVSPPPTSTPFPYTTLFRSTISNDIAAANNATVDLTSGAGITEGAAKITTGGALGMSAAGTINVNSTTND